MHLIETVEPLAKASASPPPVMEINDPVKRMDVLEVEVQAIEAVLPTEINEIQKQIDLTEVSNQQIAIKEPGTLLGSTERAVMTQPELLDVGINTIQTVQPEATAPPSSQAITERIELGKQMNISEHGVQAEEAEEPVNTVLPAQRAESPKQVELAEVNVQQTETTEPEAQLFSNEKAVIMTHPVLLDLGIHAIETIEPDPNASATPQVTTDITEDLKDTNSSNVVIHVEEAVEYEMPINSTQRAESQEKPQLIETDAQATEVTETAVNVVIPAVITTPPVLLDNGIHPTTTVELVSNVQAKETMQPASQMDDREVFRGEPVQSEDCDQETKANVNNTEEENDQDVWMDAEEVVYNQEVAEKSSLEIEEPEEEMEAECVHEEEAKLEEVELASYSRTEEEESQQEVYNRGETCEIESEGEDFAIALEHQEYATASITTLEWD
ncbi:probable serine/threonine-protein kinase kinX [Labrus mixtus]|uniref:probable serine/threonine-protein kinase kinX n=1 Tax=Labrus mixtus TaxID=508554 RepID=UPI0029C0C612|nr:probable serine/threonine-protein kinase kinX [Labrus mixtus]